MRGGGSVKESVSQSVTLLSFIIVKRERETGWCGWWVDMDDMDTSPHHINGTFYQAESECSGVFVVTAGLAVLRWQQALAVACVVQSVVPSVLWPRHATTQRHLRTLNFQSVSQSGDWGLQEATNNNLLPLALTLTLTDHNITKYTQPEGPSQPPSILSSVTFFGIGSELCQDFNLSIIYQR